MDFSEKILNLALSTTDPEAAASVIISVVRDFLEQSKSDELYAVAKAIKRATA